jgi:hypothetical protein
MTIIHHLDVKLTESPIFVLGAPRSGTSMMQWALRQHPELWGGQESDFLVPLIEHLRSVHELGSRRGKLHWISGQKVNFDEFLAYAGVGMNALYTNRSGGLRWVEQTPQYTLHMDDILLLFPGAVFIMMLRDGRDVVASLRHFVNPVEHVEASNLWATFVSAGLDFAAGPKAERVHLVSYQDVVESTEAALAKVYAFLDLPESLESVAWITERSPINTSFPDAAPGSSIARWRTWTATQRREFHEAAGEVLIRAGFEVDDSWVAG